MCPVLLDAESSLKRPLQDHLIAVAVSSSIVGKPTIGLRLDPELAERQKRRLHSVHPRGTCSFRLLRGFGSAAYLREDVLVHLPSRCHLHGNESHSGPDTRKGRSIYSPRLVPSPSQQSTATLPSLR